MAEDTQTTSTLQDINVTLRLLNAGQSRLEENVTSIMKTVRGNNGDKGLVTQVALLTSSIEDLTKRLGKLEESFEAHSTRQSESNTQSLRAFIEKFGAPILTAIILYFLFEVVPHITVPTP